MKKNFNKIVAIVLMLTLAVGSTNVFAAGKGSESSEDLSGVEASFEKMNDIAEHATEVNNSDRISEITDIVKNSIEEKDSTLNFENGILVFDEAKVLDISEGNEVYTSITIPVEGSKYSLLSNATYVLHDNEIVTYTEALITKSVNDKFIIDTYFDGSLLESNHTDITFISNNEIQQGLDSINENSENGNQNIQTRGGAEIAGCLAAVLGVNITIALLIAGTCIASCPAVVPICVACIGGVCAIGGADIAAVVGCFGL